MVRMDVLSLYLALDEVLCKSACLWFSRCLIAFLLHIPPFSLCVLFGLFFFCWCNIKTLYFVIYRVWRETSNVSAIMFASMNSLLQLLANKVAYNKISVHFSLTLYESHKVQHYWHMLKFIEEKNPSEIYLFFCQCAQWRTLNWQN